MDMKQRKWELVKGEGCVPAIRVTTNSGEIDEHSILLRVTILGATPTASVAIALQQ